MTTQGITDTLTQYCAGSDRAAGGSSFDVMCELAIKISHASVPCRACAGHGFRHLSEQELREWAKKLAAETDHRAILQVRQTLEREGTCTVCSGSGYTTQRRADRASAMHPMFTTVRCGRCRGCGETLQPSDTSAERGDTCLGCGGATYIVPVTVKEKGSTKHGKAPQRERNDDGEYDEPAGDIGGAWFDEDELRERGRISRQLETLGQQDPTLTAALGSFMGAEGDKWRHHAWGRVFALWPHTEAGRLLARESAERSRAGHGFLLAPLDLLASERDAEARAGAPARDPWRDRRRALLGQADKQARQLMIRVRAVIEQLEAA